MKKFTFMLLAAFIAVTAMAAGPQKRGNVALNANAVVTNSVKKAAPKAQAVKVQAPVAEKIALQAKSRAKKAPKKAGIMDLLTADLMLCSNYYDYDSDLESLVPGTPAAGGWSIDFGEIDQQQLMTEIATTGSGNVSINGFTTDATEPIEAQISLVVPEEAAAEGVIATITIASGQTLRTSDYGTVALENATSEGDLTAYVYSDGGIYFNDLWIDVLADGDYAGYLWSGNYYGSFIVPANGAMTWGENAVPVFIYQDAEAPKYVTVYNFAGWEAAITATLREDKTFVIEKQPVANSSDGVFYTYGLTNDYAYLTNLTGVGTETALTFDCPFTAYCDAGYWYGAQEPATITLGMGEFAYPVIPDVAATPATPTITGIGNYDSDKGYGYVLADVPVADVDGNELKESKLFYQFFADVKGTIEPITFTTDLYVNLEEDMSVIPYTFTDNYDFDVYDGDKLVYLNYNFNTMYDRIGVKSIYTGGDETNESEIAWVDVEKAEDPDLSGDYTFDFNAMDVPTSSSVSNDGDITETLELTDDDEVVTLTVSPKEEGVNTPNRFWSTNAGPQLRVYSGTLTFAAPAGYAITGIAFNHNGKWNEGNTSTPGALTNNTETNVATWIPAIGGAPTAKVVVAIAGNTQLNNITVSIEATEGGEDEEAIDPEGTTFTFDDGTLEGWTTLDADGDGFTWGNTIDLGSGYTAHNGSEYAVYSQSYDNVNKVALTPDNYLISPKVKLGSTFSFFAVAQDAAWPSEHFGVFVSTTGKKAGDFEKVEEWTLTSVRMSKKAVPSKVQGKWYQYIVDMSAFEGQEGYVALRHFDCSDFFYMLADDITFGTPADPDPEPQSDELVELPEGVEPIEYTLNAVGATNQSSLDIEATMNVAFDGTDVYLQGLAYYFPEAYVKGTLTEDGVIIVPTGQYVGEDEYGPEYIVALDVDEENYFVDADDFAFTVDAESGVLTLAGIYGESGTKDATGLFDYFYEATYTPGALPEPEPIVAPDDLHTWYLACNTADGKIRARELQVGFSETDLYIQGLCEYLPEAWVKGTIDYENFTATFPSGQFYGTYADQYKLFFVGYDSEAEEIADVVFDLDLANGVFTTDQWIILNGKQNSIDYYDYYYDVDISKEKPWVPEPVVAPEDLATDVYHFKGFDTYYEDYTTSEVQVGFYGENEVYIQGLSGYIPEAWVVGTIEDGVVTIPETYLGIYEGFFGSSELFFSGATFVYDAEAETFTSAEGFVSYETPEDTYWMDEYNDVVLTKLYDVAATPADPEITDMRTAGVSYPRVYFNIPTEDVNGAPIMQANLAYQLYVEKDGEVLPLVLEADLYDELEEDMSEIPYGFTDEWDIYSGTVYLNQGEEEISTWTKIGIQSIYYGGGECHKSNIAWAVNTGYYAAVTITDALYATFVAPDDVDFTGSAVTAYAVEFDGTYVQLNPVTTVPAGEAVVVKADEAGLYAIPMTTDAVLGATNDLLPATEDFIADGTQYILAETEKGVGFHKAAEGSTIAAGKGYLVLSAPATAKEFYPFFGEDATGISGINAENENALIYNIAGQRLNKTQQGINIINGIKVLK